MLLVNYFQTKGRYEGLYGNIIAAKKKETQRSKVWLREHRSGGATFTVLLKKKAKTDIVCCSKCILLASLVLSCFSPCGCYHSTFYWSCAHLLYISSDHYGVRTATFMKMLVERTGTQRDSFIPDSF